MSKNYIFSIFIAIIGFSSSISGQDLYNISWKLDGSILGSSTGLVIGSYIIDNNKADLTLADISDLMVQDINSFDRSAVDHFSNKAGTASDIFKNGLVVLPFSLFLSKKARKNFKAIALMYTEVAALNGGLTILTKSATGRFRPFVYNPNVDNELRLSGTARRSFFSGHVSHVASLSFFTASIFSDLYADSNLKYAVWAGAITAPAITGYLRYKAGRHFPSDIIVGYGVGALVGYIIPKLHSSKSKSDLSIYGTNNGLGISYNLN